VFAFKDSQGQPVNFIYNYKRGTWYPFVPADGAQKRSTERELQLKAQLADELPIEPELERWFPLWAFRSRNPPGPELRTERLLLRRWRESDRDAFAALNANERVMEHFPALLTRPESDFRLRADRGRLQGQRVRHLVRRAARRDLPGLTGISIVPSKSTSRPP